MDYNNTHGLMAAIIYAGLCTELKDIQDETLRDVRAKQLRKEAYNTATKLYNGN